jgi:GH3 auxin-responsive promoter
LKQSLGSITTANPSTIVMFFRFIQENGDTLARDFRDGRWPADLDSDIDRDGLSGLRSRLKPDARTAERLERALADDPIDPRKLWPSLKIVQCWLGGTLSFYIAELRRYTRTLPLRDVGYRASEGFFAVPVANETPAGVLHVSGHFLEFLEDGSPSLETRLVDELEPGRKYRLIVTQSGGLYRYDMEDIVQVDSYYKKTPLVRFLHKADGALSVTGEKVTESHFLQAMAGLRAALGPAGVEFSLGVSEGLPPCYILFLEQKKDVGPISRDDEDAARLFDEELKKHNCEYASKRASGRLGPPRLVRVRPGSFAEFRRKFQILDESDPQFKPRYMIARTEELAWLTKQKVGIPV